MGRFSFCFLKHSESSVSEFNFCFDLFHHYSRGKLQLHFTEYEELDLKKNMSCLINSWLSAKRDVKVKAWSHMNWNKSREKTNDHSSK